jgi:hypothetical protein
LERRQKELLDWMLEQLKNQKTSVRASRTRKDSLEPEEVQDPTAVKRHRNETYAANSSQPNSSTNKYTNIQKRRGKNPFFRVSGVDKIISDLIDSKHSS